MTGVQTCALPICRVLLSYISHSYSLIGEVCDENTGIADIDKALAFGFNWAPPSVLLSLFGGLDVACSLMEKNKISVSDKLFKYSQAEKFHPASGRFFFAR